jgi:hypothetical protein
MTHFYFHTWRDNERLADDVGLELRDPEQAHGLAARDLGEMARDLLHASSQAARLGIDIADAAGVVLARLTLVFTLEERP